MLETFIGGKLKNSIRRPVDCGEEFLKSGMTLITDHRSDYYLHKYNENFKLAPSQQEGEETKT